MYHQSGQSTVWQGNISTTDALSVMSLIIIIDPALIAYASRLVV